MSNFSLRYSNPSFACRNYTTTLQRFTHRDLPVGFHPVIRVDIEDSELINAGVKVGDSAHFTTSPKGEGFTSISVPERLDDSNKPQHIVDHTDPKNGEYVLKDDGSKEIVGSQRDRMYNNYKYLLENKNK